MEYLILHVIHLYCAIAFIGVVFFEVLILEGVRDQLGDATMRGVEEGIITRAKRIMPWVVATLFLTGFGLAFFHFKSMVNPFNSSLGIMLSVKILLALSVLVHFVTAIRSAHNGCMTSQRFERTHISVFIHMVFIVLLAKGMFYIQW